MAQYCLTPCKLCAQRVILAELDAIVEHIRSGCRCNAAQATERMLDHAGWSAGLLLMLDDLGAPLVTTVAEHG